MAAPTYFQRQKGNRYLTASLTFKLQKLYYKVVLRMSFESEGVLLLSGNIVTYQVDQVCH